ncbi:MAG TPA: phosphate signaling complex protein PhoU [Bryobacteraceae bacterium]|jgi:phosphate transport system protein|nr:phosphate signaling complex protein PhoU [Bryobacteraceae bacterium]
MGAQGVGTQLRHFDQELEQLKSKLLAMSALVESAVYRSITAVVQKDRKLAEEVLQSESRVNQMEIEIDDQAISLLALQQPMAGDLRLITSAIKINTDLERMGDLAVNIAQRALALMDDPVVQPLIDIPHIGGLVQSMVRKALDAFVAKDAELARSVLASDDAVDNLRTAFFHELISFMQHEPGNIPQGLSLLSIVRNLERIADHSTNIAEDVLFYVKGIDVRHQSEANPGGRKEPRG